MKFPAFPLAIIGPLLALLTPGQAFAVDLPTKQCADVSPMIAAPVFAAVPEISKFESMRMQQETGLIPEHLGISPVGFIEPSQVPACLRGSAADRIAVLTNFMTPPPPPELPIVATDQPNIFGSIALPVSRTPLDAKWHAVSNAGLSAHSGPWTSLIRNVARESRVEQLQAVNLWVNARVHFTDDRLGKRRGDRWAGASETLSRSRGDCEDYAIAKLKLLEAAGVSRNDMYLVIARDLVRRADHALLVVRLDQRFMVMDSSTDQLLDAENVSDYRPIFSYGAQGTWVHGYAEKPIRIAAAF